jgi:cytochrome P450
MGNLMMDLDFTTLPTINGDHFVQLEKVRALGPVTRNNLMSGWMVVNYSDIRDCLSDTKNFTSENTPIAEAFGPQAMLVQDGAIHNALRNVWAKQMMPKALEAQREALDNLAAATIDRLAARLQAGETVDVVKCFEDFTADGIIYLMGLRTDQRGNFQQWNRLLSDLSQVDFPDDHPKVAARKQAKVEIYAMLSAEVQRRRDAQAAGRPMPDDLISLMTAAEGSNGIDTQKALDNLLNLFTGALDTTVKWMGNTVMILHQRPELLIRIRATATLLPKVMDEVMRYESVVQLLVRRAKSEQAVIAGTRIPQGDFVYLLTGAAGRDPVAFSDPLTFDPERKAKQHLGFGYGFHVCLGMNLARLESNLFFTRFFEKIPEFTVREIDYGENWLVWGPRMLKISSAPQSRPF